MVLHDWPFVFLFSAPGQHADSSSKVFNETIAVYTRAEDGPTTIRKFTMVPLKPATVD